MMAVCYSSLPEPLKGRSYGPIKALTGLDHCACHSHIARAIRSDHSLLSPAQLRVLPQIAGGLRIPCIEESMDESGLGTALICGAVENVGLAVVNIFDCWKRFEENIYQCVSVLSEVS